MVEFCDNGDERPGFLTAKNFFNRLRKKDAAIDVN
jgi:hypothetical protein